MQGFEGAKDSLGALLLALSEVQEDNAGDSKFSPHGASSLCNTPSHLRTSSRIPRCFVNRRRSNSASCLEPLPNLLVCGGGLQDDTSLSPVAKRVLSQPHVRASPHGQLTPGPKRRQGLCASGSSSSADGGLVPGHGLNERKSMMRPEAGFAALALRSFGAEHVSSMRAEVARIQTDRTEELRKMREQLLRSEANVASLKEDLTLARTELAASAAEVDRLSAESIDLHAKLAAQAKELSQAEGRNLEAVAGMSAQVEAQAMAEAQLRKDFESNLATLRAEHAVELAAAQQTIAKLSEELAHATKLECDAKSDGQLQREVAEAAKVAAAQFESEACEAEQRLKRCQGVQERQAEDAERFTRHLAEGYASEPPLAKVLNLDTMTVLGMGAYGFVVSCQAKSDRSCSVVKLMGERWAGLSSKEWAHGTSCVHSHIVKYGDCYLHHDYAVRIKTLLQAAFAAGTLSGREPQFFPRNYFCLTMEYMDRGSTQGLVNGRLLTVESAAAVTRQVASALAYLHKLKRTHNDVKPENILLKSSCEGNPDCLVAKLADFGLAEHSVDRGRDCELLAYSVWCMLMCRTFDRCPSHGSERQKALEELSRRSAAESECAPKRILMALGETIGKLWRLELDMSSVEHMEALQGLGIRLPRHPTVDPGVARPA